MGGEKLVFYPAEHNEMDLKNIKVRADSYKSGTIVDPQ
jgi:hypothetical protein